MNRVFFLFLAIGMLSACNSQTEPPQLRTYTEITEKAPVPERSMLKWTLPKGWEEKPGQGMRLVTFQVGEAEGSIVILPGLAGGFKANVQRWLGQIGVQLSEDKLEDFLKISNSFRASAGWLVQIVDMTSLVAAPEASAMIVALVHRDKDIVFVKLMGPGRVVSHQKEALRSLLMSLHEGVS